MDLFLNQAMKDMIKGFNLRSSTSFVRVIIQTQAFIDNSRSDTSDPVTQTEVFQKKINNVELTIHEYLNKIKTNYRLLPEFAYELRCQDLNDVYTPKFLGGLKPEFLYDVIMSNSWRPGEHKMHSTAGPYLMTVGKHNNVLQYKVPTVKNKYVWPFIKTKMNKSETYDNEFTITLTNLGFQLGRGIFKFLPQNDEIHPRSYQWMLMAQGNYEHASAKGMCSAFIFDPVDPNNEETGYRLFVNRGEQNPYLLANKVNPILSTKAICSTVRRHGINNPDKNTWYFTNKRANKNNAS